DMAIPFFFFLGRDDPSKWLRRVFRLAVIFAIPATLFTYSRGAFLGLITVLWLIAVKTKRKFSTAIAFVILGVLMLSFAPREWYERTDTIVNYEGDGSAMGRLMLWGVAFRYALDHPLIGGGFLATAREEVTVRYGGYS